MVVMVWVQAARGPTAAVAMVLWAVAGRKAVLGGRHIRVAYQPAREVRRSTGLLVTPSGRGCVQGVVMAVVVMHDRVVRKARDETHGDTPSAHSRTHTQMHTHSFSCMHAHNFCSDAAAIGFASTVKRSPVIQSSCLHPDSISPEVSDRNSWNNLGHGCAPV